MFMRSEPTETLSSVVALLDRPHEALAVNPDQIRLESASGRIIVGEREVPSTDEGLDALAGFVDFPRPFLTRLDPDLRDRWVTELLARQHGQVVARVGESGLRSVLPPSANRIDPRQIAEVAARVLTDAAPVTDFGNTPAEFYLDAVLPEGINDLGDPRVGDITRAGLRFHQNVRQNLVPSVSPFSYRLLCTNGMQTRDDGLKIEGRGQTVDEVLAELEAAAQRAFARVESSVQHFYDLRNVPVENVERSINRRAAEQGLSDRLRLRLIDGVASMPLVGDEPTEFDVVNYITNQANDPSIRRRGARLELQRFGGALVTEHANRCRTCASKLD